MDMRCVYIYIFNKNHNIQIFVDRSYGFLTLASAENARPTSVRCGLGTAAS